MREPPRFGCRLRCDRCPDRNRRKGVKTGAFFRVFCVATVAWAFPRPASIAAVRHPVLLGVSPHLYEIDIRLLHEIGADADAFELLRRQFRFVAQPDRRREFRGLSSTKLSSLGTSTRTLL